MYLKQAGAGLAAQNQAAEIKIMAERKAGQLLASMGGSGRHKETFHRERFSEIGISHGQSHRWQTEAI